MKITRRQMLGSAALAGSSLPLLRGLLTGSGVAPAEAEMPAGHAGMSTSGTHPAMKAVHTGFASGPEVNHRRNGFDPSELVRDFDWGKTRRLPTGQVLREWQLAATDKDIEVAPGLTYPAWVYNGRIRRPCPGGERLDSLGNGSSHAHDPLPASIRISWTNANLGSAAAIKPGETFTYEFRAV
jgi:hypothetical protein